MKKVLLIFQLLLTVVLANAQMLNPVKVTSTLKTNGSAEAEIVFSCKIHPGWHVYSTGLGADGPISASFNVNKMEGAEPVGKLKARGKEISTFDPLFEMKLRYFEGSATFVQKIKFTKPTYVIDAYLEYGACSEQNCLPPSEASIKKSGTSPAVDGKEAAKDNAADANKVDAAALAKAQADSLANLANAEKVDSTASIDPAFSVEANSDDAKAWWKPVVKELQAFGGNNDIASHGILYIFIIGFVGGLLALVMPCIWPIIPMTVSFFLKRAKNDKKKGIRDAIALDKAGVFAIVLEKVPAKLAAEVTRQVKAVTIGIGAGNGCDGQVLVYADALGMTQGFKPKFLRHFAQVGEEMQKGVKAYIDAVKSTEYPSVEESY